MSKVKEYIDRKEKAIHRLKRIETAHKKYIRKKKANRNEYGFRGWSGYYIYGGEKIYRSQSAIMVRSINEPSDEVIYLEDGTKFVLISKRKEFVKKFYQGSCKKRHRTFAARQFRRNKINEDTPILKGCKYRRYYDIDWALV